jgi:hypothetical protein
MQVRLTSNGKEIERLLKKRGKALSKSVRRALSRTALAGIQIIEERTAKGKSYKGGSFKPYSKLPDGGYFAWRKEQGLTTKPNLSVSGNMLSSLTSNVDNRAATIFFSRATEAEKAAKNNATRPFFGFSDLEEKTLGKVFFRTLK